MTDENVTSATEQSAEHVVEPTSNGLTPGERHESFGAEERRVERRSTGRFRLLAPHIIGGNPVPAGTEIGTDTAYPYYDLPSNQMEGVDEAGIAAVNELHQRLYGKDAPWHEEGNPFAAQRQAAAEAAEAQKEELKSEPVSHQQAWERGHDKYRDEVVTDPRLRPTATPTATRGGDTSIPMGPATADQNPLNPDVQVRTTNPLRDQKPVG